MGSWRGLQAPGKARQQASHRFLITNGRANLNWQNWVPDQKNDVVMDCLPVPFIQIHPDDRTDPGLNPGDMVEVCNDVGATRALVYPEPTARRNEAFMIFGAPNDKKTRANIRKISGATTASAAVSYKSWEAARLAARGLRIAGIVPSNHDRPDRNECDMDLHLPPDGPTLRISKDCGE